MLELAGRRQACLLLHTCTEHSSTLDPWPPIHARPCPCPCCSSPLLQRSQEERRPVLCWLFDTAEALLGAGTPPLPSMYYLAVAASWSFPWLGCAGRAGREELCRPVSGFHGCRPTCTLLGCMLWWCCTRKQQPLPPAPLTQADRARAGGQVLDPRNPSGLSAHLPRRRPHCRAHQWHPRLWLRAMAAPSLAPPCTPAQPRGAQREPAGGGAAAHPGPGRGAAVGLAAHDAGGRLLSAGVWKGRLHARCMQAGSPVVLATTCSEQYLHSCCCTHSHLYLSCCAHDALLAYMHSTSTCKHAVNMQAAGYSQNAPGCATVGSGLKLAWASCHLSQLPPQPQLAQQRLRHPPLQQPGYLHCPPCCHLGCRPCWRSCSRPGCRRHHCCPCQPTCGSLPWPSSLQPPWQPSSHQSCGLRMGGAECRAADQRNLPAVGAHACTSKHPTVSPTACAPPHQRKRPPRCSRRHSCCVTISPLHLAHT